MRDATHDSRTTSAGRPADATERSRVATERAVPVAGALDVEPPVRVRPALLEFRTAVARLARERRDEGVGVERVIPEVRRLARAAAAAAGIDDEADAVVAHAVRWSIEAYFDEPALRHVPRFY